MNTLNASMDSRADEFNAHLDALVTCLQRDIPMEGAVLESENSYQYLSLCVIDSVYSIGVNYGSVKAVIRQYCQTYGLTKNRERIDVFPQIDGKESLSILCARIEEMGFEKMASDIFCNLQRTSTRSGILKSQAVYEFAKTLRDFGIESFQDLAACNRIEELATAIKKIKGQGTGISFKYFLMLAGDDSRIKPDRMIIRYVQSAVGKKIAEADVEKLFIAAAERLKKTHKNMTPRLLDGLVWGYERKPRQKK